uniref:Uncharacterized protein n=1 Tax=Anguilla anguilla TaxID=7936 RepID=A0A0E9SKA7_ANGAN
MMKHDATEQFKKKTYDTSEESD